jgi:hypothetical protein
VTNQAPIFQEDRKSIEAEPLEWLGRVLTNFARAEQAIGKLCIEVGLSTEKGSLCSLNELRKRLSTSDCKRSKTLDKRIERWQSIRGIRHLLAHATLHVLFDENKNVVVVSRHLPKDANDVTPDKMWTQQERVELLRVVTNDGRSIADQVKNLLEDAPRLKRLKDA